MENRTARLTLLLDPRKKKVFEQLCDRHDVTPSQLIRKFIRDYIEQNLGADWQEKVYATPAGKPASRANASKRRRGA